jgi:hypothetical protein
MATNSQKHILNRSACLFVVLLLTAGPAQALCNNPPVAVADQAELIGSLATVDVLANDTEPDGEAVEVQIVSGTCLALGTVEVLGGVATYRADPGPVVPCGFSYRASDEEGLTSDAAVAVTVPPTLFADGFESGDLSAWSAFVP